MVTLPPDFVAVKYPGYFWHLKEKKLYSLKVGGVLRQLYHHIRPNYFNNYFSGYKVSVDGRPRYLGDDYLMKLKQANSVIPVKEKE